MRHRVSESNVRAYRWRHVDSFKVAPLKVQLWSRRRSCFHGVPEEPARLHHVCAYLLDLAQGTRTFPVARAGIYFRFVICVSEDGWKFELSLGGERCVIDLRCRLLTPRQGHTEAEIIFAGEALSIKFSLHWATCRRRLAAWPPPPLAIDVSGRLDGDLN